LLKRKRRASPAAKRFNPESFAVSALQLSILTFFSTALGGAFALRFRSKLYLIMGFSAGILVAAALVDLLPEAAEMIGWSPQQAAAEKSSHEAFIDFSAPSSVFLSAVLGFLLYYSLDFFVHLGAAGHVAHPESEAADHHHDHGDHVHHAIHAHSHNHASRFGSIAAAGLVVHSLLDGFAIGGASHTDSKILVLVAIAVLAHDFGDGVTTVGIVLGFRSGLRASIGWLLADAIAPVIGCALALAINISPAVLANLLGFFAGSFLFIGAAHLLPEAEHEGKRPWLYLAVVAGFVFITIVSRVLQA
jgi:zinc and cadmium transporter